jgi:hypothetical protein
VHLAHAWVVPVGVPYDGGPDEGVGTHVVQAQVLHQADGIPVHGGVPPPPPAQRPRHRHRGEHPRQAVHQGVHQPARCLALALAKLVLGKLVLSKLVLAKLVLTKLVLAKLVLTKLVLAELLDRSTKLIHALNDLAELSILRKPVDLILWQKLCLLELLLLLELVLRPEVGLELPRLLLLWELLEKLLPGVE